MDNPDAGVLAQLRDIHLPPPVGWWPLAPGWYVLIIGIVLLGLIGSLLVQRYYKRTRAKRQALHLLDLFQKQYKQQGHSQRNSARISELLRRVAIAYYPREQVAGLKGEAWIAFLNSSAKGLDFHSVKFELLELPYQTQGSFDLNPLFKLARQWINQRCGSCLN